MKRLSVLFFLLAFSASVHATSAMPGVILDKVNIDLNDKASLQDGAHIFINFCLSCHSAGYMRYNRMGRDLGISEELIKDNLLFAAEKVGDLMTAVMPKEVSKAAFGAVPPDLTLVARSRSPEWFYTYMRSFYRDDESYSGWNNIVFPHVAMPHVLYEWQGHQRAVFKTVEKKAMVEQEDGTMKEKVTSIEVFDRFELEKPGSMSQEDFDTAMRDLTNYMVYMAEPVKLVRYRIGVYVLIFLAVFLVVAYKLKKEYWKDVH